MHGLLFALGVHMHDDDARLARGGVQPSEGSFLRWFSDWGRGRIVNAPENVEALPSLAKPPEVSTLDKPVDRLAHPALARHAKRIGDILIGRGVAVLINERLDERHHLQLAAGQHA